MRPDRNGIVSNNMQDDTRPGQKFTDGGEQGSPIGGMPPSRSAATAEKAGIRTATMFWPGSNVAWGGTTAKDWPNDITGGTRLEDCGRSTSSSPATSASMAVIDWLRRPRRDAPAVRHAVFPDTVDTAGHTYGPFSPEATKKAAAGVDASIGRLLAGLRALGQPANLVIVADHGMAATSRTLTVAIDKIANLADYRAVRHRQLCGALYPACRGARPRSKRRCCSRTITCNAGRRRISRRASTYGTNPRIPPYFCLAEVGWLAVKTTPTKEGDLEVITDTTTDAPDMRALFIATGPGRSSRWLGKIATFDNVDVEPLLRDLLELAGGAEPRDGDDTPFQMGARPMSDDLQYFLEDLVVGAKARFGAYQVTREEVVAFAEQFDPQPFHLSDYRRAPPRPISAGCRHRAGTLRR